MERATRTTAASRTGAGRTRARRLAGAVAAALLAFAAACGSDGDSRDDPGALGPHPVGVRRLGLEDASREDSLSRGPRFLLTEVWYPAVPAAADLPRDALTGFAPPALRDVFGQLIGGFLSDAADGTTGAVRDAELDRAAGPYPLIVLSHGNLSVRYQNFTLAEHLASHGFVVAACDHIGNSILAERADGSVTLFNPLYLPIAYFDRITDVRFVVDRLLAEGAAGAAGPLAGGVDGAPGVGVGGHSFGGSTTIAVANADPRVAAAMPMAAAIVPVLTQPMHVPALVWTASEDKTIGERDVAANRTLVEASSGPRILATFRDGGHFTFTDGCTYIASAFDGDGCGSGVRYADGSAFEFVAPAVASPLIERTATAFFRRYLKGDLAMEAVLAGNPSPAELDYLTFPSAD